MRLKKERQELRYSAGLWVPLWCDERNKLFSFSKKATLKANILRYSDVLYRITNLEKSERFDSSPHDFI